MSGDDGHVESLDQWLNDWIQRPFYTSRKTSVGPQLTNLGALVIAQALFVLLGVFFLVI